MQRGRTLAVLALACAPLLASCGGGGGTSTLPDVEVAPLAGGTPISLADLDGPAVVNLWATWCWPCRKEIPDFEAVHQSRSDIAFVGINVGAGADEALQFIEDTGATYPQYLDPDGLVETELEATGMPVTVVVDADGTIVSRHLGAMTQDELNDAIDAAVGA